MLLVQAPAGVPREEEAGVTAVACFVAGLAIGLLWNAGGRKLAHEECEGLKRKVRYLQSRLRQIDQHGHVGRPSGER